MAKPKSLSNEDGWGREIIMGRLKKVNGKAKGNKFELDIAKAIAETINEPYGTRVRRTPGSGSLLCRADLWVHHTVRYKFPWYLELKKRQTIRLEHVLKSKNDLVTWYKESKEKLAVDPDYPFDTTPTALIFAKNNVTPFIMMSVVDYHEMDLSSKYPETAFKLYFCCNEDRFIILEWSKFLEIYRVSP